MKLTNSPYTLITGASSGLGRALAFECASRGMNLILVSLPEDNLDNVVCDVAKKYPVKTQCFELDLTNYVDFRYLVDALKGFNINWLINNVGKGGTVSFEDVSDHYIEEIIDLNIRNTCLLTFHLLPELLTHKRAHILNISSLLSLYPTAYKTIYPASKAFIHSFSLGLRQELRNTNTFVSVALPGPMDTNHDVHKRLQGEKYFAKIAVLSPSKVAKILIDEATLNKGLIIPGTINKFYWLLMQITPYRFGIPYLSKIYFKEKTSSHVESPKIKHRPAEGNLVN